MTKKGNKGKQHPEGTRSANGMFYEIDRTPDGYSGLGDDAVEHLPAVGYVLVDLQFTRTICCKDLLMNTSCVIEQQFSRTYLKQNRRESMKIAKKRGSSRVGRRDTAEVNLGEFKRILRPEHGTLAIIQVEGGSRASK